MILLSLLDHRLLDVLHRAAPDFQLDAPLSVNAIEGRISVVNYTLAMASQTCRRNIDQN